MRPRAFLSPELKHRFDHVLLLFLENTGGGSLSHQRPDHFLRDSAGFVEALAENPKHQVGGKTQQVRQRMP